jgi:hypothetical protein
MEKLINLKKGGRYVVSSERALSHTQRAVLEKHLEDFFSRDDIKILILEGGLSFAVLKDTIPEQLKLPL